MIIVETGEGLVDANSYASVEYCNEYHAGHLYGNKWNYASAGDKEKALRMATRTEDANTQYDGYQVTTTQALQWPRYGAYNSDAPGSTYFTMGLWPDNEVPRPLKDATCELARELLKGDRTQEDSAKGIKKVGVGQGAVAVEFDPSDRKGVFTETVEFFLRKVGRLAGYSYSVPVYRV